ncbi:MAG TPA: hypothetical protein PK543_03170 [Candidatus Saccharibacteria bacterium]|nr:hypothetical protein [Candidatus Saccharibacteria bacterium]
MFRKIVSNLPFSPALVGQLGFYAKRLRKEEATRRIGLIFVVLALVVQSLAVFQPPESANASSPRDMVAGGLGLGANRSLNNFLVPYDANTKHLKDTMNYVGITRAEIAATKFTSWIAGDKLSWGFGPRYSYAQGERQYSIPDANGNTVTTVYSRPHKLSEGPNARIWGWVGYSKKVGWFAIMQSCGNLVTDIVPPPPPPPKCVVNSEILASSKECQPCPGNESLWISDKSCIPHIEKSKTATNTSQGFIDASTRTAHAGDQISYTISIANTGLSPTTTTLEENLSDVLDYASLVDNGGGVLDKDTKVLSWGNVKLDPGAKQTRTFVVRLPDTLPATAQGSSDNASYDCIMTNTYGNSIDIKVDCPAPKVIEKVVKELPPTGPTENMIFAGIVLAVATFFYARTRQVREEVRLVRRNVNAGSI